MAVLSCVFNGLTIGTRNGRKVLCVAFDNDEHEVFVETLAELRKYIIDRYKIDECFGLYMAILSQIDKGGGMAGILAAKGKKVAFDPTQDTSKLGALVRVG